MKDDVASLHAALGYKPLNRVWAKIEIVLGLAAAGAGLLLGNWGVTQLSLNDGLASVVCALGLFVLGGYLAMAGHRSHLYQSNNELMAYLARTIRESQNRAE